MGNDGAAPNGMNLFSGVVVFFDDERFVTGITIEDARGLVLAALTGQEMEASPE